MSKQRDICSCGHDYSWHSRAEGDKFRLTGPCMADGCDCRTYEQAQYENGPGGLRLPIVVGAAPPAASGGQPAGLHHERSCPKISPSCDDACTCGLEWRIALQTEQTMHAAWRKRAEEAEASAQQLEQKISQARMPVHFGIEECIGKFKTGSGKPTVGYSVIFNGKNVYDFPYKVQAETLVKGLQSAFETQGNSEEAAFRKAMSQPAEVMYLPCGCTASAGSPKKCPEHGDLRNRVGQFMLVRGIAMGDKIDAGRVQDLIEEWATHSTFAPTGASSSSASGLLASQIRDQIRAWLKSYSSTGPLKCFVCDCIHSAACPREEGIVDSYVACLQFFYPSPESRRELAGRIAARIRETYALKETTGNAITAIVEKELSR